LTVFATVTILDVAFFADPVTHTLFEPSQDPLITFHYPSVTLTSLTPGEVLFFVGFLFENILMFRIFSKLVSMKPLPQAIIRMINKAKCS
jgi:hypothetical protein